MSETEAIKAKDEDDTSLTDTTTLTENVGEISVEINVQDLIAQIEAEGVSGESNQAAVRRRLEELREGKNAAKNLEDFDDYDLED
jgi:hypothetical protein